MAEHGVWALVPVIRNPHNLHNFIIQVCYYFPYTGGYRSRSFAYFCASFVYFHVTFTYFSPYSPIYMTPTGHPHANTCCLRT